MIAFSFTLNENASVPQEALALKPLAELCDLYEVVAGPTTDSWCPRQDSNLRPQDSYHFGFRRRFRVRGLDCPFTIGRSR